MATVRLIVNADDYGLTPGVNRAIVDAHRDGIVTSATVMATGGAFDEAVSLAASVPGLGVGVHLNLSEGEPVAGAGSVPTLIASRERMGFKPPELAMRIARGRVSRADIERELRAQIERVLDAGVRPTHFDGHKHVHMLPAVFEIVVRLAVEYGVPALRCAPGASPALRALFADNRGHARRIASQFVMARVLSALSRRYRRILERAGLRAPDYFVGVPQTGFLSPASLEAILQSLPPGTSELMCHPGYPDDALKRTPTRLVAEREREYRALVSPRVGELVRRLGIELVSYGATP